MLHIVVAYDLAENETLGLGPPYPQKSPQLVQPPYIENKGVYEGPCNQLRCIYIWFGKL